MLLLLLLLLLLFVFVRTSVCTQAVGCSYQVGSDTRQRPWMILILALRCRTPQTSYDAQQPWSGNKAVLLVSHSVQSQGLNHTGNVTHNAARGLAPDLGLKSSQLGLLLRAVLLMLPAHCLQLSCELAVLLVALHVRRLGYTGIHGRLPRLHPLLCRCHLHHARHQMYSAVHLHSQQACKFHIGTAWGHLR